MAQSWICLTTILNRHTLDFTNSCWPKMFLKQIKFKPLLTKAYYRYSRALINVFIQGFYHQNMGLEQPGARAHRSLLHFSIFGLSATDKKGFQNTVR